ncbi:MAG TPA: hypothetical protein VG890_18345, partial [Puia sp.]|nr:hypothetical protein [Puia sp.]
MINRFLSAALFLFFILFTQLSQAQDFRVIQTLNASSTTAYIGLQYAAKDDGAYGVGLVDDKATLKWQLQIPGLLIGLSKRGDDLLAFYAPNSKTAYIGMEKIENIRVARISPDQKRIIKDVELYVNNDGIFIIPSVKNDPDSNFCALVIQKTPLKESGSRFSSFGSPEKQFETVGVTAIFLDDALQKTEKELKTAGVDNGFVTGCADKDHNLYLASVSGEQLTVEKFNASGNLADKLTTGIAPRDKLHTHGVCEFDVVGGNAVNLLLDFENHSKKHLVNLYHFDFSAKKAIQAPEQILDKDYARSLSGGEKVVSLKEIESLKAIQILETADQIIAIREIQYLELAGGRGPIRVSRGAAIVSVYTRNLELVRESVIEKSVGDFTFNTDGV